MNKKLIILLAMILSLVALPVSGIAASKQPAKPAQQQQAKQQQQQKAKQQQAKQQQQKKMDQATFNKKLGEINKSINNVKNERKKVQGKFFELIPPISSLLLQIYDAEAELDQDSSMDFYVMQGVMFAERDAQLEEYFYDEELEVLAPAFAKIDKTINEMDKLEQASAQLDKKFGALLKQKNWEAALNARAEQLKQEQKLLGLWKVMLAEQVKIHKLLTDIVEALEVEDEQPDDEEIDGESDTVNNDVYKK